MNPADVLIPQSRRGRLREQLLVKESITYSALRFARSLQNAG
jgi:hypothetical protein